MLMDLVFILKWVKRVTKWLLHLFHLSGFHLLYTIPFKMDQPRALYHLFLVFSNFNTNCTKNKCEK